MITFIANLAWQLANFNPKFLFPSLLSAKREHQEKWYQEKWCEAYKGQVEVALPDGTRCDCLTDTHAIEFDFGRNWAEAVGQRIR